MAVVCGQLGIIVQRPKDIRFLLLLKDKRVLNCPQPEQSFLLTKMPRLEHTLLHESALHGVETKYKTKGKQYNSK